MVRSARNVVVNLSRCKRGSSHGLHTELSASDSDRRALPPLNVGPAPPIQRRLPQASQSGCCVSAMTTAQRLLGAGAVINLLLGILHVAAGLGGEAAARFFTAPPAVIALIQQRSLLLYPIGLAMLLIFAGFAAYAWSGAGFMRRLPLLRTALVLITAVFLLRGALIVPQILFATRRPGLLPPQAFGFSVAALLIGLTYLLGTIGRWRQMAPTVRPAVV